MSPSVRPDAAASACIRVRRDELPLRRRRRAPRGGRRPTQDRRVGRSRAAAMPRPRGTPPHGELRRIMERRGAAGRSPRATRAHPRPSSCRQEQIRRVEPGGLARPRPRWLRRRHTQPPPPRRTARGDEARRARCRGIARRPRRATGRPSRPDRQQRTASRCCASHMNASGGADGGMAWYAPAARAEASARRPHSANAYIRVIRWTSGVGMAIWSGRSRCSANARRASSAAVAALPDRHERWELRVRSQRPLARHPGAGPRTRAPEDVEGTSGVGEQHRLVQRELAARRMTARADRGRHGCAPVLRRASTGPTSGCGCAAR